jgi:DNA polymerase-3 subunit epsilon
MDKFETLLNPERNIPEWITRLTHIDDAMVKRAPTFRDVAKPLHQFLTRGVFTAHNARFDFGFVQTEFHRLGQDFETPQVCTLKLARLLYPGLPSRSLGNLCEALLIDVWDRHRARGDAEATVYVLKEILRNLKENYGVHTWDELERILLTKSPFQLGQKALVQRNSHHPGKHGVAAR